MAGAGIWLQGVLKSWRGRAGVAAAIGAVGLAAAVPAVALAGTAAPAGPRVIATTAVGANPSSLVVNPRSGTVYVVNNYLSNGSERVAVLNPRTNKLTATIPIKGGLSGGKVAVLGVSPVTGDVYVDGASPDGAWVGGAVTVISGRTNKVIGTIPFHDPHGGVVSPVTGDYIVANTKMNNSNTVSVINGDKVIATVAVPYVWSMAVSPRTGAIYLGTSNGVTVISGRTYKVIATIARLSSYPSIAVSPVTGKVYAEDGGCDPHNSPACTGSVTVISDQTNEVIAVDSLKALPGQIAFGPHNGDVYVSIANLYASGANPEAIAVISGQTNKVIDNITFPFCQSADLTDPASFTISPRTGNLYVPIASGTSCQTYSVQEVGGQTNKVIGVVPLPTAGGLIAANPVNGEIYVLRLQVQARGDSSPDLASVIAG